MSTQASELNSSAAVKLLLSHLGQFWQFSVVSLIDFNLLLTCHSTFLSWPIYFLMCVQVCVCLLIVHLGHH